MFVAWFQESGASFGSANERSSSSVMERMQSQIFTQDSKNKLHGTYSLIEGGYCTCCEYIRTLLPPLSGIFIFLIIACFRLELLHRTENIIDFER